MRKRIANGSIERVGACSRTYDLSLSLYHKHIQISSIRYAVIANLFHVTTNLLDRINSTNFKSVEKEKLLRSSTPRQGCVALTIPGGASIVCAAAAFASEKTVCLILERGADPYEVDSLGNDALIFASMMGELGSKAIRSIPAYVEMSTFMLLLCPDGKHENKEDVLDNSKKHAASFRSWRNRGWCIIEYFAFYHSAEKTHPVLLVRSSKGDPE